MKCRADYLGDDEVGDRSSHNLLVYIPLTYATKYQPEIHGFVEESEFVSEGPTEWLIRQPFR